jgi:hypothetical protein
MCPSALVTPKRWARSGGLLYAEPDVVNIVGGRVILALSIFPRNLLRFVHRKFTVSTGSVSRHE